MAKFVANSPEELTELIVEMEKRLEIINRLVKTDLGRAMLKAGHLVEARAKEIITEKGHIISGNLRRSIHTQVQLRRGEIIARVGTPLIYGPYIEGLPDGGYLNPAAEQRAELTFQVLHKEGVEPGLLTWEKARRVSGGGTMT